jgi:hypothetical protein
MDVWEGYLLFSRLQSGQYIDLYETLDFTLEFIIMMPEELLNITSHGHGNQLAIIGIFWPIGLLSSIGFEAASIFLRSAIRYRIN